MKKRAQIIFFWLQRYFQVDLKYIFHGSFWLTIGRIVSVGSSVALAIVVANYVPPEIYGQYKYVVNILGLLTLFSLLGMSEAATLAIARGYEGDTVPALITKMRWSVLGSTISAGTAAYYFLVGNTDLAILLVFCAIALPFYQSPQIFHGLLMGRKLFRELTTIQMLCSIATSIALGITFFLTNNVLIIFSAFLLSYIIVRWTSAWYIFAKFKPNQRNEKDTLSFGKHLSLIRVIQHISNHLDSILVWHFAGAIPLAIYAFATQIPNELFGIVKGLQTLAMPKFASAETATIKRTLPGKAVKLLVIILLIVIAYILVAPLLFELLFPEYVESIIYTQLFALTFLFMPKNFFYQFLVVKSSTRSLYLISNSTQILQLVLIAVLAYQFQIFGIIIARILSQVYNTSVVLYFFKKL